MIDKPPQNRYILFINAMKKSVCRRRLFREPGQGGSPVGQSGMLSLLSRGGEEE